MQFRTAVAAAAAACSEIRVGPTGEAPDHAELRRDLGLRCRNSFVII